MTIAAVLLAAALQSRAPADTILALVAPERGVFEYTSGILQIVVLVLAAVLLGALTWLAIVLRKVIQRGEQTFEKLTGDVRPILGHAAEISADARITVARLRDDVERVTDAANAISDQLLDAADVTARRIDEVNAVLDVVQHEIEQVAISSVAAVHGVRTGASEMVAALGGSGGNGGVRRTPRRIRDEMTARRRELDELDDFEGDEPG
jgi:uncharacterized protein YoxC